MNEVEQLQAKYDKLMCRPKVTKQDICALLVPFRDKHGLTDLQTLKIARKDFNKTQLKELFRQCALWGTKEVVPYSIACYNMSLNIWWYKELSGRIMIVIHAYQHGKITLHFSLAQLKRVYQPLKPLEQFQQLDKNDYREIRNTIINEVVTDSNYRLDTLD